MSELVRAHPRLFFVFGVMFVLDLPLCAKEPSAHELNSYYSAYAIFCQLL
jgi:hypothetical protein